MAPPGFVASGAQFANINAVAAGLPTGWAAGHFHLLLVETSNEPIAAMSGWANIGAGSISIATGTVTALTARSRVAQAGDTAPTVPDSGDHQMGRMLGFSGVDTASPFDGSPVFNTDTTTGTTISFPTLTTTVADCLIIHAIATGFDTTTSQVTGNGTNAALTGLTNRGNGWVNTGGGGGLAVITGVKATPGSIGTTTVPIVTGTHGKALFTVALKPAPAGAGSLPIFHRRHRGLIMKGRTRR